MTVDPSSVTLTLMTHDVDTQPQQLQQQPAHTTLVTSDDAAPPDADVKVKTPGSSRRGKQYKCGHCHELGHNQYVYTSLSLSLSLCNHLLSLYQLTPRSIVYCHNL